MTHDPDVTVVLAEAITKSGLNEWLRHTEQEDANREWARTTLAALTATGYAVVKVVEVLVEVLAELDAVHYPDPELKGRGGCVMCWPKDGSWPCATRMIADDLRAALESTDA